MRSKKFRERKKSLNCKILTGENEKQGGFGGTGITQNDEQKRVKPQEKKSPVKQSESNFKGDAKSQQVVGVFIGESAPMFAARFKKKIDDAQRNKRYR